MLFDTAKTIISVLVLVCICYVVYVYDKDQVKDGGKIMLGSNEENKPGDLP